ncbi:MAG: hypothetical protein M1838_002753 [Thelocarpon superellum]|nr:MAG: hypothetical protein M1838_002753 [Thelocarpon superellum]
MSSFTLTEGSPAEISANFKYQLSHLSENHKWQLVALNVAMLVLSTVSVVLRLWARRLVQVRMGWDDWLILISLFLAYGLSSTMFMATHFGVGTHLLANSYSDLLMVFKALYSFLIIYGLEIALVKISILLFYLRIFPARKFRRLCIGFIVFTVGSAMSIVLVAIFQCDPISEYWTRNNSGTCINPYKWLMAEGGITLFINASLLILPIPLVWRLQLKLPQKLGVLGFFCAGSLVCIASIVRIPYISHMFTVDPIFTGVVTAQWSVVEANMGIICACLPVLRPVFFQSSLKSNQARVAQWQSSISKVERGSQASFSQGFSTQALIAEREATGQEIITRAYQHLGVSPDDSWFEHIRALREIGIASIASNGRGREDQAPAMGMTHLNQFEGMSQSTHFEREIKQNGTAYDASEEGEIRTGVGNSGSYVFTDHSNTCQPPA